jgi:hypothetical protein
MPSNTPEHPLTAPVSAAEIEQGRKTLKGGRFFRAIARLAFGKGAVESTDTTLATHAALVTKENAATAGAEKAVQPYFQQDATTGVTPAVIGSPAVERAAAENAHTEVAATPADQVAAAEIQDAHAAPTEYVGRRRAEP